MIHAHAERLKMMELQKNTNIVTENNSFLKKSCIHHNKVMKTGFNDCNYSQVPEGLTGP